MTFRRSPGIVFIVVGSIVLVGLFSMLGSMGPGLGYPGGSSVESVLWEIGVVILVGIVLTATGGRRPIDRAPDAAGKRRLRGWD